MLWWLAHRVSFSTGARVGMAVLFCIHTIGTHYTYSLTPYNDLTADLFGTPLNDWFNWQRNHYDRFVHFSYGAMLAAPILEALRTLLPLGSRVAAFFMLNIVLASSAVYELMEWSAAVWFGGDLGTAYLGTQGDPWDAQADIALAGVGALLVLGLTRWIRTGPAQG